ncbi:hypothetical protein EDD16DRAFT_1645565 [Pisolithus croceorrhizus]|nr:hypothetical protein EDD16DRAFT_1645565 [Pisolithus croceorrhizus]
MQKAVEVYKRLAAPSSSHLPCARQRSNTRQELLKRLSLGAPSSFRTPLADRFLLSWTILNCSGTSRQASLLLTIIEDRLVCWALWTVATRSFHGVLLHLHKHLSLRNLLRLIEDGGKSLAPANRLYAREHNKKILDGWKLQFSLRGKPAS